MLKNIITPVLATLATLALTAGFGLQAHAATSLPSALSTTPVQTQSIQPTVQLAQLGGLDTKALKGGAGSGLAGKALKGGGVGGGLVGNAITGGGLTGNALKGGGVGGELAGKALKNGDILGGLK